MPRPALDPEQKELNMKASRLKYYAKIRDARLQKWREEHPNPLPRGRPRKITIPPRQEEEVAELVPMV